MELLSSSAGDSRIPEPRILVTLDYVLFFKFLSKIIITLIGDTQVIMQAEMAEFGSLKEGHLRRYPFRRNLVPFIQYSFKYVPPIFESRLRESTHLECTHVFEIKVRPLELAGQFAQTSANCS